MPEGHTIHRLARDLGRDLPWDQVRHCSAACRSGRLPVDRGLDALVLALLSARAPGATICPSEVARRAERGEWRALMPRVREAVARLEAAGAVVVTQGGEPVALEDARGPYRVRRAGGAGPGRDAAPS